MEEFIWPLLTILRLLVPFAILRWPLGGILAAALIDSNDYNLLPLKTEADYTAYQSWDKLLDIYSLSFIAMAVCRWQEVAARIVGIGLYVYRVVGVGLMEISGDRQWLLLFPNVFENFVVFYLLYRAIEPYRPLLRSFFIGTLVIVPLALLKLLQEYYLHIEYAQPGTMIMGRYDMLLFLWTMYILIPCGLLALVIDIPGKLRLAAASRLRLYARFYS